MNKKKYNHAFDIAFKVESYKEEGHEVSKDELLAGLMKRIVSLMENGDEIKHAVDCFDTYEV